MTVHVFKTFRLIIMLKLHSFSARENWAQYTLLVAAVILVALFGLPGLACTIMLYVVLSLIKNEK